jgi:hypothetical protein
MQAAQRAADDIAAIPTRFRRPLADTDAVAPDVSLKSDVDWSKFTVLKESVAYSRYLQVRSELNPNRNLIETEHDFSFDITSSPPISQRRAQVNSRSIRYPNGSTHDFDICVKRQPKTSAGAAADPSTPCGLFVCVLPYFSADGTVALIRCAIQRRTLLLLLC